MFAAACLRFCRFGSLESLANESPLRNDVPSIMPDDGGIVHISALQKLRRTTGPICDTLSTNGSSGFSGAMA
jgi:hypothetical protein